MFKMGSNNGDDNEKPIHTVTVKSFSMSKYPVTQKEWFETMGTTVQQQRDMADRSWSMYGEGGDYPMYYVSWYEAIHYCNRRSQNEGLAPAYSVSGNNVTLNKNANGYRLPTEAEWEFAAKGGKNQPYPIFDEFSGSNIMNDVAWYDGNSGGSTHPVGTKKPNALGLHDMSGNVWEWCWDWHGDYLEGLQADPVGASSGSVRVRRGGGWNAAARYVRSAFRGYGTPAGRHYGLGFRLVLP
jgi:formylglycine-generating enzyme required for sulfatase activity